MSYPWYAHLTHIALGFLAGLLGNCEMLTITTAFIGYEYLEQRKIKDTGYKEMLEYTIGLLIGILTRVIFKIRIP